MQTVVAGAPLLSHVLAPLQDGGVYATRSQCRRSRQSRRTSADDDDILHSQKATADIGRGRARSLPHPAAGIGAALRMKALRRRRCVDSTVEPCSSTCRAGSVVRSAASSSGSGSRVVVSPGFASALLPPGRPSQLWSSATPSGRPRSVRALPLVAETGFLIGPHDRPIVNEPQGETFCVGIVTTPVGCRPALGLAPATLRGRVVDLLQAWPRAVGLRRELSSAGHRQRPRCRRGHA